MCGRWLIRFLFSCVCKFEHWNRHSRWCCCLWREHQEKVSCLLLLKWCTIWECDAITVMKSWWKYYFVSVHSLLVRISVISFVHKNNVNFESCMIIVHVSDVVSDTRYFSNLCLTDWLSCLSFCVFIRVVMLSFESCFFVINLLQIICRVRTDSCCKAGSKACREKLRRERLNERHACFYILNLWLMSRQSTGWNFSFFCSC